jgi:sugar lactone lactonase YvrE
VPPPKFIKQFGTQGDLPGELHSPIGIAIDTQDRIYITEFKNNRVQVFDTDGNSLQTIAVASQPGGIAVDKEGRIYVALMVDHKIVVFDADGQPLREWGKSGSGDGEFSQPGGVAIGRDGSVYVVDQANHRIQRFSAGGTLLAKFGGHGSEAGQFGGDGPLNSRLSGPHFCAFDRDGHLYTTEGANLRVQQFDADGKPLLAWTGAGEGPGCFGGRPADRTNPFEGPIGIAVDQQGRIWVSSTNNRVQCFSADGKFLTGIGDEGGETGEFIIPHGLAIDSHGWLYVVDASNQRVQVFELQ